ncbi:hypothetical protein D9613_005735 [Agrocybe pediades]|uniref:Uncharacterized protein n=1 Tax=Agrocybe pediades TaxID=84607 RepID=A0A8H4QU65_9AGAR|nr:hypothetical protein D9613_005735 [Agrocybe pediades]
MEKSRRLRLQLEAELPLYLAGSCFQRSPPASEAPVHVFCVSYSSSSGDSVDTDALRGAIFFVIFALDTKLGTLHLLGFAYLTVVPQDALRTKLFLTFPGSSQLTNNLFNFLRYSYPKRLPASRKVILDTDVYRITHVGKGVFAVMSRVTLDQKGLAKYEYVITMVRVYFHPAREPSKTYGIGKGMLGFVPVPRVTFIIDKKGIVGTMEPYTSSELRDVLDATMNFGARAKFVEKLRLQHLVASDDRRPLEGSPGQFKLCVGPWSGSNDDQYLS